MVFRRSNSRFFDFRVRRHIDRQDASFLKGENILSRLFRKLRSEHGLPKHFIRAALRFLRFLFKSFLRICDHGGKIQIGKIVVQFRKAIAGIGINRFAVHGVDDSVVYKICIYLYRVFVVAGA